MSNARPTLTYGAEVWPTTVQIERKHGSFENRVLRAICGPVFDTDGVEEETKKQGKSPK